MILRAEKKNNKNSSRWGPLQVISKVITPFILPANDDSRYFFSSDIWSLGVIFLEMNRGERLVDDDALNMWTNRLKTEREQQILRC